MRHLCQDTEKREIQSWLQDLENSLSFETLGSDWKMVTEKQQDSEE